MKLLTLGCIQYMGIHSTCNNRDFYYTPHVKIVSCYAFPYTSTKNDLRHCVQIFLIHFLRHLTCTIRDFYVAPPGINICKIFLHVYQHAVQPVAEIFTISCPAVLKPAAETYCRVPSANIKE